VEEGAERAGLSADRSTWRIAREVYVAESSEQAREEALNGVMSRDFSQYFLRILPEMKMLDLLKTDPDMPDSAVTPEYLVDNIWVVGSPDEVTQKLEALYEDVGGFGVLLAMGHEWQPREKWVSSMTMLARAVAPRLPTFA
jgi:alkanesulfonate monooxygenase SsuD/methylene tetrahydromethanopterin reductase-like flavin-dependent oxidoreductase (luciferase family)